MKLPQSRRYVIPGGLNPIEIDVEKGEGIYVEPNVWMVHEIRWHIIEQSSTSSFGKRPWTQTAFKSSLL
jgi:hypothetical protein